MLPNLGLESLLPAFLYATAVAAFLLSVFWRPMIGIYYTVPLIPLQTVRYRLNDLPLGSSMVYIMLLGIALGLLRQRRNILPKTPWTMLFCVYLIFTFTSLCLGSLYLGSPMPWSANDLRLPDWADFATMPATFLLVSASISNMRQVKTLFLLMCLSALMLDKSYWGAVSEHDFSSYSDDLREGGSVGYAGANGLAALEAQMTALLVAMGATEKARLKRCAYFGLAAFSIVCLVYSLSRGGYLACFAGLTFVALLKLKKLFILLAILGITWTSLVPSAVVSRVDMTYDQSGGLDESSETRVTLWQDALELLQRNPLLGTGYDTYRYMRRVREYEDTHNIYLKILVETGVVGLLLFLGILAQSFRRGLLLFLRTTDGFSRGLGLGLAAWVICTSVACLFGDRWTYYQIQGWFWVLAALVGQCWILHEEDVPAASGAPLALDGVPQTTAVGRVPVAI